MDTHKRVAGFLIFLGGIAVVGVCYMKAHGIFSLSCAGGFLFFISGLFIWDPSRDTGEGT